MYCTGGRGGKVLFVDNLNDQGKGSFREAIEEEGPRTIIFRVSGTIELSSDIHITDGDLTVAGQTAPGEGICLKNYGIRLDADNVILRFIRVRPGDVTKLENDALSGLRNRDIIVDHCSFSWSNDEVASMYDNENFTMQWCIISESLYKSSHHKGEHGYGGIWGGLNASYHHNLLSDHSSRNPRLSGSRYLDNPEREKADLRNNVIYNWGNNSIYGGEEGHYNIVNNYFKPGPATRKNVQYRILDLTQVFYDPRINPDTLVAGKFYIEGNFVEGFPEATKDNWGKGVQGSGVGSEAKNRSRLSAPVIHTGVTTEDPLAAFNHVLQYAGASLKRDPVDRRIIDEVRSGIETFGATYGGGNKGIIDSQEDAGGWPLLKTETAPPDADDDGMPDAWEIAGGLDPAKANSREHNLHRDYTDLEIYINSLVDGNAKVWPDELSL